ncbi:DUF3987 domain-containing protein [Ralstonia solanacearum]|uniref:DUF3987 domain-containing protein n=1 Tax=Ralstonia solanacearum TaxID=305 RepID=UPI00078CD531|nr:DUF3987 domain-containing protein [Ralstonia solanacearum]AMP36956.1 hypothetical protein LBM2029_05095 [Ralstonia solanacearum]AXV85766.1 DUF3987 domain-containing protein [Ralstonia solanacearum]AXW05274.1 DUF3987 domain-containing protein [Ralstonia solanacearum]AXW23018.1 DUF3987 domain-containing protein [Ralstonia solanacearum]AXW79965.1 DUF3987 domain-containing protein [Ralstonia solanacearum]
MKVPRYPYNALPSLLGDVLQERSKTPKDDAIGASVLEAVSSLVASGLAVYEKPEGGTAPLSSFGILLASSGAGKSFHYGPLTDPITRWCAKRAAQASMDQYQQQAARRVWKKRVLGIEKVIQECVANGEGVEEVEALLAKVLAQEPLSAVSQTLLQDDASMQAVLRSLEHWPVSGWIVDEGAVALNMLRAKDFPTLANLSGGKVIQHSRVGEPHKEIKGFLTTLFMIQPGLFKAFCKKRGEELKASGLAARFLYHAVLDEWIGSEDVDHAIVGRAHEEHSERVTVMLDEFHARIRSDKKALPSVAFVGRAKVLLRDFQERNLDLMAQPGFEHCRDFLAKLAGHIARMAAKNHVFLGREGDVSVELVEMAEQVCWYHFEAYQWMHNPLEHESQRVRDAATLTQWLHDHGARQFAYHHASKIAVVIGMTTTRLRSAVGELFNQDRARIVTLKGKHYIEVLPPADRLDNVLGCGGV